MLTLGFEALAGKVFFILALTVLQFWSIKQMIFLQGICGIIKEEEKRTKQILSPHHDKAQSTLQKQKHS